MVLALAGTIAPAREHWTELNIGPFFLDTEGDIATARYDLAQMEQVRWVLGGLLESQDLRSLWPIRVVLTKNAAAGTGAFVEAGGQYLLVCSPTQSIPLGSLAGLLLDNNTPRLPEEAESGLRELFSTLKAEGSRVTWGGTPAHPDLAWARMQLFATRFEYGASFHIFVTSLKNGSSLTVSERNAFGKDPAILERQANENLAAGKWSAVPVSGRPLDPKRDLGEHSVDSVVVDTDLGYGAITKDPRAAEALFKTAIESGGTAKALGFAGLAQVAKHDNEDPTSYLNSAVAAGSVSAPVYVDAAKEAGGAQALALLKTAAKLNPAWAEPIYQQAELASKPADKESLLKKAAELDPRHTAYWLELAQLQSADGHPIESQGTWLRAEDSAPTAAERERIHEMRVTSEGKRLDDADAERVQQREAAHLDDQRAQDNEAAQIRAAEEKANRQLDAAAGGESPQNAVPWEQTIPQKKINGVLTQVDCLRGGNRVTVRDRSGKVVSLLLDNLNDTGLICGTLLHPKRVTVSYGVEADDRMHTSGKITAIQVQ